MHELQKYFKIRGEFVKPRKILYDDQRIRANLLIKLMQMEQSDIVKECIEWVEFISNMHTYIWLYGGDPPNISLLESYKTINDIDTIHATLSEHVERLEGFGFKDRQSYKTIEFLRDSAHKYISLRDELRLDYDDGSGVADLHPPVNTDETNDPDDWSGVVDLLPPDDIDQYDNSFIDDLLDFLNEHVGDPSKTGAAGPSTKKRRKQVQLRL